MSCLFHFGLLLLALLAFACATVVVESILDGRLIALLKLKVDNFLYMRRYRRERKYFLSQNYMDLLAEYQKLEHDSRLDRIDIDKGAK